jgi:hypothetical protein
VTDARRTARAALPALLVGAAAAMLAGLTTACPRADRCTADAECDAFRTGLAFQRCDIESGLCLCSDDRACGPDELCNAAGRCQARGGCVANDDCGAGLFCDIQTAQCLSVSVCGTQQRCCTLDSQCAFGFVCDSLTQACVEGCRDEADCLLGQGCVGGGFGRLGQCGSACTADNLCRHGELCNLSSGSCELDTRGPYCLGCSGGTQSDDCGTRGNYCLLDTVNGGAYCGVDCASDQACPFGYTCADVIILPRSTLPTCRLPEACVEGRCARSSTPCTVDEDCPEGPPGSDCPRADVGNCELDPLTRCIRDAECPNLGACLKQECRAREGAAFGVCSCTKDSDCPRDRCVGGDLSDPQRPVVGNCELSGHTCFEDAECDIITCVSGGCLLGRNCKPASGLSCADFVE